MVAQQSEALASACENYELRGILRMHSTCPNLIKVDSLSRRSNYWISSWAAFPRTAWVLDCGGRVHNTCRISQQTGGEWLGQAKVALCCLE